MKLHSLILGTALLWATSVCAQDNNRNIVNNLSIDGRVAYEYQGWDGMTSNTNTGFKGQYLYLSASGNFSDNVTFDYRQRLDQIGSVPFFDATELLNISWAATRKLHISGGKQHVAIGGFEYNTAPIDLYYNSEFWNQFSRYELGVSIDYDISRHDNIRLQVNNSSFRKFSDNHTYGGNLLWTGKHGFYESSWSVNMTQYKKGEGEKKEWMNYIALGNRFNFCRSAYLSIDVINRTTIDDMKFAKNYSIMSELSVKPTNSVRVFAKYTRDCNEDTYEDLCITPGTELNIASGGIEYEPLKHQRGDLRLFLGGMYSWGKNTDIDYAKTFEKEFRVEAGIKFNFNVIK